MIIDAIYVEKLKARFWPRVNRKRKNQCWPWTHSLTSKGYGRIGIGLKYKLATHVMWFLTHGVWPKIGEMICHSCDNPPCVNPGHLFMGDANANMQDCVKKKRHVNAKKTHCPKGHGLSDAYVTSDKKRICRSCSKEKYIARRAAQVAPLGITVDEAMSKEYRSKINSDNAKKAAAKLSPEERKARSARANRARTYHLNPKE